jgi:hypothetical protein
MYQNLERRKKSMARRRKECYRLGAKELGYHLVRHPLPDCVVLHVRSVYPSPDGEYMGFFY